MLLRVTVVLRAKQYYNIIFVLLLLLLLLLQHYIRRTARRSTTILRLIHCTYRTRRTRYDCELPTPPRRSSPAQRKKKTTRGGGGVVWIFVRCVCKISLFARRPNAYNFYAAHKRRRARSHAHATIFSGRRAWCKYYNRIIITYVRFSGMSL